MQGSYACSLSTQLSAEWERTFHILVWFSLNFFKAIKENLIILNSELYEKKKNNPEANASFKCS